MRRVVSGCRTLYATLGGMTVSVTFRLEPGLVSAVDARAVAERRKRSDVLRMAVEAWVADMPAAKPAVVEELRQRMAAPVVQPHTTSAALPAGWGPDPLNDIA